MDKFGIFNLLSSLFDFYNKNPPDLSKKNEASSTAVLSSENQKTGESLKSETKNEEAFLPLQQSMISTMKSHDEFVKRVKEKNKLNV